MKKLLIVCAAVALFASCDKTQRTANKMEGGWDMIQWQIDGQSVDLVNGEVDITTCKLKDTDCDMMWSWTERYVDFFGTIQTLSDSYQWKYTLSENGNEIFLTLNEDGAYFTYEGEVTLDGDNLEIEFWVEDTRHQLELSRQ